MKVYDQNLNGTESAGSVRTQEASRLGRGSGTRTGAASGDGDRVELSGALTSLSRALESFSSSRPGRVQQLAQLYQSGAYHPDAAAISHAMVSDALAAGSR